MSAVNIREAHADTSDVSARNPDVAIVHEWLTNMAGSEKCVEALRTAFPLHRIYTSVINREVFPDWGHAVATSLLQRVPLARRSHVVALPLIPAAMRSLQIGQGHDLVIRSFHSFATLPRSPAHIPQIVYCHTPPRFLHRRSALVGERGLVRAGAAAASAILSRGDRRRMRRQDVVVANSRHIADRVADVYGLEAQVIHPPVNIERFRAASTLERGGDFVFCSRLVPYKRPDVVLDAFRGLPYQLKVVGRGRLMASLARSAPSNVTFLGHVSDEDLPALLGKARGFVFPAEEDFGIAPVEAMAAGTPVIALAAGGALDYVTSGETGLLVGHQTPGAFAQSIRESTTVCWDHSQISASATRFSEERFIRQFRELASRVLAAG